MIREVYINDQLIDIESDNVAGYIFSSPIFRDISKIISNRTTTYKIPKTTKNLAIFGLASNPDVDSLAPYREHKFLELRDGLPFIDGVCFYLKTAEKELELAVFWGNSEKLQSLKDKKLRDLRFMQEDYQDENGNEIEGYRFLFWNENTPFLFTNSTNKAGFLKVDFGQGVDDMQYIHPCVNAQYIFDLIKSSTGIQIDYPVKFQEEFKSKWFPLVDKVANSISWGVMGKYYIWANIVIGYNNPDAKYTIMTFKPSMSNDIVDTVGVSGVIKAKANTRSGVEGTILRFRSEEAWGSNGLFQAKIYLERDGNTYAENITDGFIGEDGHAYIVFNLMSNPLVAEMSDDVRLVVKAAMKWKNYDRWGSLYLFEQIIDDTMFLPAVVFVRPKEVQFGDKYPIINNLPDLSVLDFLKSLMSMYGLFTYYSFIDNPDAVRFVSIDEMYSYKYEKDNEEGFKAYDWTNKLLLLNSSDTMKLEYTYGEYARKNKLKYKNDKDVTINADGYIEVDNHQLEAEKDLIELPYSPSNNMSDEEDNKVAKIPIYGNSSNVGIRILNEGVYKKWNEENSEFREYKSASFDEKLYFSGNQGLIKRFYSKYQAVMLHPVVVECAVYMSDVELHLFREINPVYIDGIYYMPITVTVQTNGVANCKLIKMTYIND